MTLNNVKPEDLNSPTGGALTQGPTAYWHRDRWDGGQRATARGHGGRRHGSEVREVRHARIWSSGAPTGEASALIRRGSGTVAAGLHRFMELQSGVEADGPEQPPAVSFGSFIPLP
jgi:hypothetical protein